jgi:hypothetical protein
MGWHFPFAPPLPAQRVPFELESEEMKELQQIREEMKGLQQIREEMKELRQIRVYAEACWPLYKTATNRHFRLPNSSTSSTSSPMSDIDIRQRYYIDIRQRHYIDIWPLRYIDIRQRYYIDI